MKKILAIPCIAGIARFLTGITRRRVWLDRLLVQGKLYTVFLLTAIVLLVPLVTATIFYLFNVSGSMFINYDSQNDPNIFWSILYHCIDPGNQHMANEGWARTIACIIALFGIIFINGVIVSAFVGWYERFVDK